MKTGGPGSGPRHRGGPAEQKAHARSLVKDFFYGDKGKARKEAEHAISLAKKFGDKKNEKYWTGVRSFLGEAEKGPAVYVAPRYPNIKPEGEIDPRDFPKQGKQGGGHAGGSESEARKPMTMEGKRGWTERQRAMHSKIGKRIARSN